jgi:hypothetical protein
LAQLPLKVLSIETGEVLKDFKQLINRAESIVVVEQFNQKLLLKQVRGWYADLKRAEADACAPLPQRATAASVRHVLLAKRSTSGHYECTQLWFLLVRMRSSSGDCTIYENTSAYHLSTPRHPCGPRPRQHPP